MLAVYDPVPRTGGVILSLAPLASRVLPVPRILRSEDRLAGFVADQMPAILKKTAVASESLQSSLRKLKIVHRDVSRKSREALVDLTGGLARTDASGVDRKIRVRQWRRFIPCA